MTANLRALAVAVLLLVGTQGFAQKELTEQLGGPDDSVELRFGVLPDGTGGKMTMVGAKSGGLKSFEIPGIVQIRSKKLNLDSQYIRYDAEKKILEAKTNVSIDQAGVKATAQMLTYDFNSGVIVLSGSPDVRQVTDQNNGHFTGMDQFTITRGQNGKTEVRMTGGESILCELTPIEGAAPKAAGDTPGAPANKGFAGMGDRVKIVTRTLGKEKPNVSLSTGEGGTMGTFYARGSVVVESDTLNLRTDQLQYDNPRQIVEALNNVYVKQENVEAECGRMEYNIAADRITLSINPVIRKEEPNQIVKISDITSCIITRNPDGTSNTDVIPPPDRLSKTEFLPKTKPTPAAVAPTPSAPREIDINNPEDLKTIRK